MTRGQLDLFGAPPPPPRPRPARDWLKVATWNVNGIRARHAQVRAWIEQETPDVVCLQEIKASPEAVPVELTAALTDYTAAWHGHKGYSGVALLLRRDRFGDAPAYTHPAFDIEHRVVSAEHEGVVFASVYVPNGGKDFKAKMRFLKEMVAWAGALRGAGKHLVLCGDLNVARTDMDVHPEERHGGVGQLPIERAQIEALLAHDLIDVGRAVAPDDDRLYTWWAPWRNKRQRNIGWRLDYVAAARAMVDERIHCAAYRDVGTSDHGPVIAHLRETPA